MEFKYQLRTSKVKGINFHPHRSWIIISNFDGEVKIVDYRLGSVLKQYNVSPKHVRCWFLNSHHVVYSLSRIPPNPATIRVRWS